jgi:hypothetical protein
MQPLIVFQLRKSGHFVRVAEPLAADMGGDSDFAWAKRERWAL